MEWYHGLRGSDRFGAWSALTPFFVSGNTGALHSYSTGRWARAGLHRPTEEPSKWFVIRSDLANAKLGIRLEMDEYGWAKLQPGPRESRRMSIFYPELFTLATGQQVGSHFFGLYKDAKEVTKYHPQLPLSSADGWKGFVYEAIEMSVEEPEAGVCPSGTRPVYRLFRAGTPTVSANHRYTTDASFYQNQVATGIWKGEGVVFCGAQ